MHNLIVSSFGVVFQDEETVERRSPQKRCWGCWPLFDQVNFEIALPRHLRSLPIQGLNPVGPHYVYLGFMIYELKELQFSLLKLNGYLTLQNSCGACTRKLVNADTYLLWENKMANSSNGPAAKLLPWSAVRILINVTKNWLNWPLMNGQMDQILSYQNWPPDCSIISHAQGVKTINRWCPSQLQITISWLISSIWSLFNDWMEKEKKKKKDDS